MKRMGKTIEKKPPVLILDGYENALSLTRSFGRRGIDVYLSTAKDAIAMFSKYCNKSFPYPNKETVYKFWTDLLVNNNNRVPHGSVIFPCNDYAVEFVAKNRSVLEKAFILDDFVPEIHLAMLDKKKTLQLAKSLNIATPNFWEIEIIDELPKISSEIMFPVIIKPLLSHLFQKRFSGKKYFFANDLRELRIHLEKVFKHNLKVMVSEFIPGPDSQIGSYYTYVDSNGESLFHFTKKVIRRSPPNEGMGSYHKTEWDEEIAALGLKFFKGINFRGLGNIEFKRDLRDGKLKVMECNVRFTQATELLIRSGMDISLVIYNHLVGIRVPLIDSYQQNLRLWFPVRDFSAYRQLKKRKEISFWEWVKSLRAKHVFPYFKWSDPLPSIVSFLNVAKKVFNKRFKR